MKGQCRSYRRPPADGKLQPRAVMGEIGKADYGMPTHPQCLRQHSMRFPHFLEALVDNHEIEGLVRVFREAVIYILVGDAESA